MYEIYLTRSFAASMASDQDPSRRRCNTRDGDVGQRPGVRDGGTGDGGRRNGTVDGGRRDSGRRDDGRADGGTVGGGAVERPLRPVGLRRRPSRSSRAGGQPAWPVAARVGTVPSGSGNWGMRIGEG